MIKNNFKIGDKVKFFHGTYSDGEELIGELRHIIHTETSSFGKILADTDYGPIVVVANLNDIAKI